YYETGFSTNPHWKAEFKELPDHPIARGVKPFSIQDEWYFNIRFAPESKKVTPILKATPPDRVRGTAAAKMNPGREEIVAWAVDLGCGDLTCYNKASKITTPNFDRLAEQGMRFTDAHSPSGVCTPTRYGLLTGRYCWRTPLKQGVLQGYDPLLIEEGRLTVAS